MKTNRELKCIKVEHTYDGETTIEYISYYQFKSSYINERWEGERRYEKMYTIFGDAHKKTIITNPFNNKKSVRIFTFPDTIKEARQIDEEQAQRGYH